MTTGIWEWITKEEPAAGVKGGSGSGNYGHSGRPGIVGGSGGRGTAVKQVTMDQLRTKLSRDVSDRDASRILKHLNAAGVDVDDLKDLSFISTDSPNVPGSDYSYTASGFSRPGVKGVIPGVYTHDFRGIYIHPRFLQRTGKTLVHELGHHVTRNMTRTTSPHYAKLRSAVGAMQSYSDTKLRRLGLRRYSLSTVREFGADAYVVSKIGSDTARSALGAELGEFGLQDMVVGLKESKEPVTDSCHGTCEIVSVRIGGIVEFRLRPAGSDVADWFVEKDET